MTSKHFKGLKIFFKSVSPWSWHLSKYWYTKMICLEGMEMSDILQWEANKFKKMSLF